MALLDTPDPSDMELFDAWCGGDSRAGSVLTRRHLPALRNFFERKVRDRETAADLVQSTLEKLVKNRQQLANRAGFRGFLFGIAWNVLKTHYREQSRERLLFPGEEQLDLASITLDQLGISSPSSCSSSGGLLVHALHRLPIEGQQMLMLHFNERMKYDEIAEVFAIPPGTVASRLSNARKLLEQVMLTLEHTDEGLSSKHESFSDWAVEVRSSIGQPALGSSIPRRLGGGWRLVNYNCDGDTVRGRYRRLLQRPVVELEVRRMARERSGTALDTVSIRNREWIRLRDHSRREFGLRHFAEGREFRLIHRPTTDWDSVVALARKLDLDKLV